MTRMKTIQSWEPSREHLFVRDESGKEQIEFQHTQSRPDKEFREIPSIHIEREELAKQYPSLALRLVVEDALAFCCSRSQDTKTAGLALIKFQGDRAASILLKIARSQSPVHSQEVRCGAIEALGAYPSAEVADNLKELVDDRDEPLAIRCTALLSLGEIGSPHTVHILENQLSEGPAALRRAAARALAKATPTSIRALEAIVQQDPDARVARQAYVTIRAIERRVGEKLSSVRPPHLPRSRGPKRDAQAEILTSDHRRSGGRR